MAAEDDSDICDDGSGRTSSRQNLARICAAGILVSKRLRRVVVLVYAGHNVWSDNTLHEGSDQLGSKLEIEVSPTSYGSSWRRAVQHQAARIMVALRLDSGMPVHEYPSQ